MAFFIGITLGTLGLALLIVMICGYLFGWEWTGLVKDANFTKRTLWDWLELLIVPAVLAAGGLWFTRQQTERQQRISNEQAQDQALQAYLDQIGQLLLDKERPLRGSKEGDAVRTLARSRTLTVLRRLDGERKGSVVLFLQESTLLEKGVLIEEEQATAGDGFIIDADLSEADLSEADLSGAILNGTDLRNANLSKANLKGAYLVQADLRNVDLTKADLSDATLNGATLWDADLTKADLSRAHLRGAKLRGTDLTKADLSRVDLSEAVLGGGGVRRLERLTLSLEGATMPNGQKYEDYWINGSEGRAEDGKNGNSS